MTKVKGLNWFTQMALPLIVLSLFACGDNGDTLGDMPTTEGGDDSRLGSQAATPVAEMQGGPVLTTEEYAEALEEIFARGDDEVEAASADFILNGVISQDEAERIQSLETSESWSDDDVKFAVQFAETTLQAVTGFYDVVLRISMGYLEEVSSLRPLEHLSDLHSKFIATAGETLQFFQLQVETVKNASTEIKNREELAGFQAIVNSLESGPLDPALEQEAEELRARGDAACLALKSRLESELERDVSFCN